MKISAVYRLLLASVWFYLVGFAGFSQEPVTFLFNESSLTIKGTSSLHDWEEKVEKFDVNLNLKVKEKEITGIDKVIFNCKSASIVSESSMMTNKTHDALQVEKYPEITFKLVSIDKLSSQGGTFSGTLTGDICLCGITKRANIVFTGNNTGSMVTFKGSEMLSLSDYKIKPPTAMLGTLKTGNEVTIFFSLHFKVG